MGFISEGRTDVFFSYTHDDNTRHFEWISQFYDYVARVLPTYLRDSVRQNARDEDLALYMDREGIPRTGPLYDWLEPIVKGSEFLFVFIGKSYSRSEACGFEFQWFTEQWGNEKVALQRTFIIVLEEEARKGNWRALEKYRNGNERSYYFDFSEGSRPIPSKLKDRYLKAYPNPDFTDKFRVLISSLAQQIVGSTAGSSTETIVGTRSPSASAADETASRAARMIWGADLAEWETHREFIELTKAKWQESEGRRGIGLDLKFIDFEKEPPPKPAERIAADGLLLCGDGKRSYEIIRQLQTASKYVAEPFESATTIVKSPPAMRGERLFQFRKDGEQQVIDPNHFNTFLDKVRDLANARQ
jgi:hypothetical protein